MASYASDTALWSAEDYRRRKLHELQQLLDLLNRQFPQPPNPHCEPDTIAKVTELRERALSLIREISNDPHVEVDTGRPNPEI
jgi:hypothetical protein